MAKLTTKARNALSTSTFALPGRRYPIPDASHARNALARAAQHASPAEEAKIRAKVHAKFPGIGEKRRHMAMGAENVDERTPPRKKTEHYAEGCPNVHYGESRETRRMYAEHGYCMGSSRV